MVFDIGSVFAQWQMIGVYDYLLPFLLIFCVVFGILETTKILSKQKMLHVIIAVVIGLMSVWYANSRMGFTLGQFMEELFPRLGVGLAVLLALLILIGLFVPENERRYWGWGLSAVGVVIFLIIIVKTFDGFGYLGFFNGGSGDLVGWILGGILLIGLIIAVATSGNSDHHDGNAAHPAFQLTPWRS